jgi:hypothetical protein
MVDEDLESLRAYAASAVAWGRKRTARRAAERALQLAPDDPDLNALILWCTNKVGGSGLADAIGKAGELVEKWPDNPDVTLSYAALSFANGDGFWRESVDKLTALADGFPGDPAIKCSLAGCWAQRGEYDKAWALYSSVLKSGHLIPTPGHRASARRCARNVGEKTQDAVLGARGDRPSVQGWAIRPWIVAVWLIGLVVGSIKSSGTFVVASLVACAALGLIDLTFSPSFLRPIGRLALTLLITLVVKQTGPAAWFFLAGVFAVAFRITRGDRKDRSSDGRPANVDAPQPWPADSARPMYAYRSPYARIADWRRQPDLAGTTQGSSATGPWPALVAPPILGGSGPFSAPASAIAEILFYALAAVAAMAVAIPMVSH